jgi:hypothetical protein
MKLPRTRHVLAGLITAAIGAAIGATVAVRGPSGSLKWMVDVITPSNANDFWTGVAAIAGILLVIVAYRGLRSLGLTKHDIVSRAEREAKSCAIARCEEFAEEIIPMNNPILQKIASAKVPVFVKDPSQVAFDNPPTDQRPAIAWAQSLPEGVYSESIKLLNRLEAWAMYFTSGVADPTVAAAPIGPIFRSVVVQNYAILLLLRSQPGSGGFPNIVMLYEEWVEQTEGRKRDEKMTQLLDELADLQSKGPRGSRLPGVIGTKIER